VAVVATVATSAIESGAVVAAAATAIESAAVYLGLTSFGTGAFSALSGIANYCLPAPA
jgi:hypothetical protein